MVKSVVPERIRRTAAACGALYTVTTLMLLAGPGTADADAIDNPLNGVKPDMGLFSGALDASWKRVVAFIWALVVVGSSVRVIVGAFKVKRAKSRGYANDLAEGSEELQDALVSLGLVGLASPIIATVLFVVGGN